MLCEMLADTAPAAIQRPPVHLLPRTYLAPNPEAGYHLHTLPRLATVSGTVAATDGGTPGVKERAGARGVETIPDEGPGMTAAGVSKGANGGLATASVRGPATAQE